MAESTKKNEGWHSPRWYKRHPKAKPPAQKPSKTQPETVQPRWWNRVGGSTWAIIVAASVLLSFLVFRADVSFTPRARTDPNDPFSTLFTVTNESAFDIEDGYFACHMNNVAVPNYGLAVRDLDGSVGPHYVHEIGAHKSQDVLCHFGAAGHAFVAATNAPAFEYSVADITLCASFRPYLWFRRREWERFVAVTDGHGKIVDWAHDANSSDCSWQVLP